MSTTTAENLQTLLGLLDVDHEANGKWQAKCPAHDDGRASLSVSILDSGKIGVKCHAGCDTKAVMAKVGLPMTMLFPPTERNGKSTIGATYDYRNADGTLEFQAVRKVPKGFSQRKPKAGGGWEWNVNGCKVIPYRLPELLAQPTAPVFVAEGEKDVDNLARIGVIGTCNAAGAMKWKAEHAKFLEGRHAVILPDNDDTGRQHADQVAKSLQGTAASVKVLELPDLQPKGDVSDWLGAGGTAEKLLELSASAPEWTPSTDSPETADPPEPPAPYVPFPVHTLPGAIGEFVAAASAAIGCDPSFIALPMVTCLARAIGNKRTIRLKRTWCEPAIIWATIIGKSGSHKTPSLQAAMQFLQKRESASFDAYSEAAANYEQELAAYDRDLAAWKKQKGTTEPAPWKPEPPSCNRFLTSDTTIEALASLLAGQFDGILVCRDELAGWLGGIAEYKGGKGSDLGHWLAAWSGAPLTVDRKTGAIKMLHVPRAAVSLVGGIQPGVLRSAIGREHLQDGLCARLLMAMPEPRPVRWSESIIDPVVEAAVGAVFDKLMALEPAANAEGAPEPFPLELTPEAKVLWVDYFNRHRRELADLDDDLAAAWSKLEAYTARFALIFQLCSWANGDAHDDAVDESSMRAAIELSDWFGGEAKRVYGLFVESDEDREQRDLVDLIRRKGGVTARELARCCRQYRGPGLAEAALEELVRCRLAHTTVTPPGPKGGKPACVYHAGVSGDGTETP